MGPRYILGSGLAWQLALDMGMVRMMRCGLLGFGPWYASPFESGAPPPALQLGGTLRAVGCSVRPDACSAVHPGNGKFLDTHRVSAHQHKRVPRMGGDALCDRICQDLRHEPHFIGELCCYPEKCAESAVSGIAWSV